jgi:hypothetical protein
MQMSRNEFRKRMRVVPEVLQEIVHDIGPVVGQILWERKLARRARVGLHGTGDARDGPKAKRRRKDELRCQDRIVLALYQFGMKSETERSGWGFKASPATCRISMDVFCEAVCRRWAKKVSFDSADGQGVVFNIDMLGQYGEDHKTLPGSVRYLDVSTLCGVDRCIGAIDGKRFMVRCCTGRTVGSPGQLCWRASDCNDKLLLRAVVLHHCYRGPQAPVPVAQRYLVRAIRSQLRCHRMGTVNDGKMWAHALLAKLVEHGEFPPKECRSFVRFNAPQPTVAGPRWCTRSPVRHLGQWLQAHRFLHQGDV